MCATKPLFICLTETWLTPEINDELLNIKGYIFFRNDRRDNILDCRRGGGTMIYVSLSVTAKSVTFPSNIVKPQGIECNFVQFVDTDSRLAFLICAYIPPGLCSFIFRSFSDYLGECMDYILNVNPESAMYVCGDFNRYDMSFLTSHYNIENIVNVPTFGAVTLDKFFCHKDLQNPFKAVSAPGLGWSLHSHNIVVIHRNRKLKESSKVHLHKVYDLRRSFVISFRNSLMTADWSFLNSSCDIESCVQLFYARVYEALSHIPVSFVKFTSKTKPWITPVVIDLINKRWSAYRENNLPLYFHYKQKVKDEIVKSKRIWSRRMCNSPKGVWSVVNDVRGKKVDNSTNDIVSLFSDCLSAAESINCSFSNFFVKSDDFLVLPVNTSVQNICNESVIFNLLRTLKTDKACGSDGILPILLKESAEILSKPLCHIINLSFVKGIVPYVWKTADICPVPKTKPVSKDQLRPISLLPVMSKICEKAILNVYYVHLLRSYDEFQFAYRPQSSTVCALLSIHEKIIQLLDDVNVRAVRLITFDMSRAFDCIPFHLLLTCISKLDLPNCNSFVNWLNSYLYGRTQRVKLGDTKSSLVSVTSGVPQGSVLGPIMFAIYLSSYKPCNDIVHVVKYADDVSLVIPIYKSQADDVSLTKHEVENFQLWCKNHQMSVNSKKSKIVNINFGRRPTPVTLLPCLENVSVIKILGLWFNDELTWTDHVNFLIKKVSQRLYVLRILKALLSHDELVLVFSSIVQSVLDYGSSVFLNCGAGLDTKLVTLCKRVFRIIHGYDVHHGENCSLIFLTFVTVEIIWL